MSNKTQWKRLSSLRDDVSKAFICRDSIGVLCTNSIQFFDIKSNKWISKDLHKDINTVLDSDDNIIYDDRNEILYFKSSGHFFKNPGNNVLLEWRINDNKLVRHHTINHNSLPQIIKIGDKLEIIGGQHHIHYIYNLSTKQIIRNHKLKSYIKNTETYNVFNSDVSDSIRYQKVIYIKSKKQILILGGGDIARYAVDSILSYFWNIMNGQNYP